MSEPDTQHYTILLPAARVAVFSNDAETLKVARSLQEDWRFARVEVEAQEGDAATAISLYESEQSPDLVIVQTDVIDDAFTDNLEKLAGNCVEGTAAIVVGPVNDVYLYRKLIDMGVSDYLVKPLSADILGDVIAKTLIERLGVTESRLITFIGAKGGTGTSALAQAAAWGTAELLRQKTFLFDLAGGWSTMSVGMGYEPATTLSEAVKAASDRNEDNLNRMLFKAGERLSVLAHGGDVMLDQPVKPEQIENLIDMVMAKYPVVIADLSQSPPSLKKAVLNRSNQIVVVSTTLLPSLRLARSLIQEIKTMRGGQEKNIELLINMAGQTGGFGVPQKDIGQAMDYRPVGIVSYDPKLFTKSESEARKILDESAGTAVVQDILIPILQNILVGEGPAERAEPKPKSGILGSLINKISKK